jgi:hypothetical protein
VRLVTGAGAVAAGAAVVALVVRLIEADPLALAFLGGIVLLVVLGRPVLTDRASTDS